MNYVAFKTHATNPSKPAGMPNEWPRGSIVDLGSSNTPPDTSGEWVVMTNFEFEGYKSLYRPAFMAYQASLEAASQQQKAIRKIIQDAIKFGNDIIIEFAAENIAMGITQLGKTKAVADYLADVMRYAQTGSLYEVLAEIQRLEGLGLPADLAPFITTERLALFKGKIQSYLGI